jgi:ribosome-binding factor A
MSRRIDRINEVLRLEISQLLARQIKDPRLSGVMTTITEVRTAPDLRNALVLVSVMGNQDAKRSALAGIQSAAKFLRRELRDRVSLRYVPFLKFALDDSFETADRLLEIMNQIQDCQNDWKSEEVGAVEDAQVSPAPTNNG